LAEVVVVPPKVTAVPLKVAETVDPAANPVPVMVSVLPAAPVLGVKVIEGVTVKSTDGALCAPAVTTTPCAPAKLPGAVAGTVNVGGVEVGTLPLESVVVVPLRVTVDPAYVAVMVEVAGNPLPDSVTTDPTLPLLGLTLATGVTAKLVDAVPPPPSVATMLRAPLGLAGTVKVEDQPPAVPTVVGDGLIVSELPPNVTDTVWLATKPVPVRVTPVVPTVPLAGDTDSAV
jgi:hypothetical protein